MGENKDIEKKVDRILFYLDNDGETGKKGLVAAFADHEERFEKFVTQYEQEQAVKKAKLAAYGAVGGGIITLIVFLGKAFFGWIIERIH